MMTQILNTNMTDQSINESRRGTTLMNDSVVAAENERMTSLNTNRVDQLFDNVTVKTELDGFKMLLNRHSRDLSVH